MTGYKVILLKLLDSFHWLYMECEKILKLLEQTIDQKMLHLLELIKNHSINLNILKDIVDFFFDLDLNNYFSLLELSESDLMRLIDLRRFLTLNEKTFMCTLIDELSLADFFETLDLSAQPLAKHCRLCRIRRLDNEELLMLHEGIF